MPLFRATSGEHDRLPCGLLPGSRSVGPTSVDCGHHEAHEVVVAAVGAAHVEPDTAITSQRPADVLVDDHLTTRHQRLDHRDGAAIADVGARRERACRDVDLSRARGRVRHREGSCARPDREGGSLELAGKGLRSVRARGSLRAGGSGRSGRSGRARRAGRAGGSGGAGGSGRARRSLRAGGSLGSLGVGGAGPVPDECLLVVPTAASRCDDSDVAVRGVVTGVNGSI